MRTMLGAILLAHGVAHLVGFLVPWRLLEAEDVPYTTTLFGGAIDVGPTGIRVVGLVWLGLALAFVANALLLWSGSPDALPALLPLVAASLVLCGAGWPAAKIGVGVDLALLAFLAANRLFGWM